jgi:hypothetical protein
MNQDSVTIFETYYIRKIYQLAIAETTGDDIIFFTKPWKNYVIRHAGETFTVLGNK